jgi:hypothetical protein
MADIYNFNYSGSSFTASGTLDVNGGVATSGSGTLTYDSTTTDITLYEIDNPPSGVITARTAGGTDLIGLDNLVFPGSDPLLDGDGLIFWMGSTPPTLGLSQTGNINLAPAGGFNIYANGPGVYAAFGANASGWLPGAPDTGTFTLSSVPEPGAVSLLFAMLASVGGLTGVLRKKLT